MSMISVLFFVWIIGGLSVIHCQPWFAHDYWNSRCDGKDGYTSYDTVDTTHGLWSDNPPALQDNYLMEIAFYTGGPKCTGCDCTTVNLTCTGPNIDVKDEDFTKLVPITFPNPAAITSIRIIQAAMFDTIHNVNLTDAFEELVNLRSLIIQRTSIKDFPNIFNSKLEILNLVENDIRFFTANTTLETFPETLTHVALAHNNIHWIPDRAFSGSKIEILSVSYNQLEQFPSSSFEDMSELKYLGLDGNMIKSVSKRHILSLKSSPLQHLNLSNNEIYYIAQNALSELQNLTILELHQNKFVTVPVGTFDNLPAMLHLEMNNNQIKSLTRDAFTNMPKLVSLLLHSQVDGMESIEYNAFRNINESLEYLWVSSNNLVTFPHQVLSQEIYSSMNTIYADHNSISNVVEFGREGFPVRMTRYWEQTDAAYVPFSTVMNLRILHLEANRITQLEETDFCEMSILLELYLDSNLLTEDTIDEKTFQCLTVLQVLGLNANQIQYVPEAVKFKDHLPSIVQLRLGLNHLTFINTNTFTELDTLQILHLHSNTIISIEDDSFPNESLSQLYLGDNEFRFLEKYPFYNLTQLVLLELQNNDITVIPDEAFHKLYSLQSLYLSGNDIKRLLKTHFKDSPLSGYLHFQNNDIGYIEDGTFSHVTSCTEMFLQNNYLSELPTGGDFNTLTVQQDFDVQNNYITSIRPGTFKDFSARYMLLNNNKIGHIYSGAFDGVSTSFDLFLTDNPLGHLYEYSFNNTRHRDIFMNNLNISVIPSLAFSHVTAEELFLQNSHVQTIQVDAFHDLSLSAHLYLQDNEISELEGSIFGPDSTIGQWVYMQKNYLTEIPDDAFDGVNIINLNLDDNLLENYPGIALAVPSLTSISLANNQIDDIPLGTFTSASSGLRDLDLRGNNITVIQADLFTELTSLQGLHMQDNHITEVQPRAFEGMNSLTNIELQNNEIQFLPVLSTLNVLSSLDLTNNKLESIEPGAFTNTPSLKTLKLGENQLGCDCELYVTLNETYKAVQSGICSTPIPAASAEVHFVKSDSQGLYFLDEDVNKYFLCAGSNFQASAPQEYEILVTFEAPLADYALENDTDIADENSTVDLSRTYYIECMSPVTTTLSAQVEDPHGNTTSFEVLFNHTHGVVPGIDYFCRLSLENNGTTSAKSYPVYVTSLTSLNNTLNAGPNDYILDITYLDFSVTHDDFKTGPHDEYRNVTLMRSHYGNWLTDGGAPLTSSMSDWFRPEAAANIEYEGNVVLKYMPTEGTHKYWNNKYFPLDTLGYEHENQRDCLARLHNFGFTSTVRGGVMYEGNGTISVGGGDQVWLAVNKTVLLEVYTDVTAEEVPCKTVDLTPASIPGGGWIVPKSGIVDILTGECVTTIDLEDEKVWLELEVGNTYHFEVFHVEREPCKSQLFIETKDLGFYQNSTVEDPAMDYFLYVPEDFHINGILEELELTDHFTTGPPFDLTLQKGNEARHFTIKDNTPDNVALGVAPAPVVYNYTVLQGVDVPFVECPSPAGIIPEPDVTTSESFTLTTTSALLTLDSELDHEVKNRYVLVFKVIDSNAVPTRTGSIVVPINIIDINDNCPVIDPMLVELVPIPSLQLEPLYYVNATDADSELNGEVYYAAATPTVDPPLETLYDITMDYYRSVYNKSNIVEVKVVVLDRGSDPVRGTITKARLDLSNSCLLNVLFTNTELTADVNQMDGGIYLRIPGYFVDPYECPNYVGLAVGWIVDSQLFASSSYDISSLPYRARLNITDDPIGELLGGWVAEVNDLNQYVGVDFLQPFRVTKLLIQGRYDADMWVETFKIVYTSANGSKEVYTNKDGISVFSGSSDRNSIVTTVLDPVIVTQIIEIHPQTWHGAIAMRMEMIACSVDEYNFFNTRCQRCRTGSYCLGDGEMYGCTSCDQSPANMSCGVNGTDHSYGGYDSCVSCPDGWICHDGVADPCPLNHYAPCTSDTCEEACLPCPEGHSCLGGVLRECTPGFAAVELAGNCSLCTAGTYQNQTGQDHCINCPAGYESASAMDHCNPCPEETYSTGDGQPCQPCVDASLCACENPTYPCFMKDSNLMVSCINTAYDGTSFECGDCPPGYTGDGINCVDIDECSDYDPCFTGRCINTSPGYQCLACPQGYTGYFRDGLSYSTHNRIFQCNGQTSTSLIEQICEDINECADKNGGCDINAYCFNYQGNYTCGPCVEGYLGSSFYGCHIDNYCVSQNHSCSDNATCIHVGPGKYRCECNDGFTGTGFECGRDSDLDGHPDKSLSTCLGFACRRDNCPSVPNSGQEDADNDKTGDNCDFDDDNDVVPDDQDNCKYVYNPWKTDTDGDGIGDDCDNCVSVNNTEQTDTDGDSIGDECDPDIDDDGVLNGADNCPLVSNPGQQNSDGDSHGDACDNCPQTDNEDQADTDQNGFGDACAPVATLNIDRDGDGIPNDEDSCPFYSNPSQSDIDNDGIGNECDEDSDGDGVLNVQDNCDLVVNPGQEDSDGNGYGDACGTDSDGDGVADTEDHCPYDPDIQYTSLNPYSVIYLDPVTVTHDVNVPIFEPKDGGEEIVMTKDVAAPLLILGERSFGDVEYSGTWYISSTEGINYFGFVFGYQSNQRFYVVMMRHENWNYGNYRGGIKGLQVKLVTSNSGPGNSLADAVWHSADTTDQVTILWHDPDIYPWQHQQPIRWHLIWRPSIGLINVRVVDREGTEVINSGDLYDTTIQGGKLGVFLFDQNDVSWSQLIARCLQSQNWALYLDGVDDYVELSTISHYDMDESFTIEVWVKINDSSISGKQPIVCTLQSSVCVYLEDGIVHGQVGTAVARGVTVLSPDHWHHVTLRYEYETKTINMFINGTGVSTDGLNENAPGLDANNITDVLYIGRDANSFFVGVIDEVRIYNRWIPETYLDYYIGSFSPPWALHQKHLRGHYSINSYNQWGPPVLYDTGLNQLHGTVFGDPAYVLDTLNLAVFQSAFPSN